MLKLKSTIRAKVEIENEGLFHVEFKRLKENRVMQWRHDFQELDKKLKETPGDAELQEKRNEAAYGLIMEAVETIEDLEDDDGAITVERFKNRNVYSDVMSAIVRAYLDHIAGSKKNIS